MAANFLFTCIPKLSAITPSGAYRFLTNRAAEVFYALDLQGKKRLRANLKTHVINSKTELNLNKTIKQAYRSFGSYLTEFLAGKSMAEELVATMKFSGLEHLESALQNENGAILAAAHYSHWELGAQALGLKGFPIGALTSEHADPRNTNLFDSLRNDCNVEVFHSGSGTAQQIADADQQQASSGARNVLRALRSNKAVAVMADRTTGGPTLSVNLLGASVELPIGPWRLAQKNNAAVLPTWIHRTAPGQYELLIHKNVRESNTEPLETAAQRWANVFAEQLKKDPTQWAAFFPIPQTKPSTSADTILPSPSTSILEPAL